MESRVRNKNKKKSRFFFNNQSIEFLNYKFGFNFKAKDIWHMINHIYTHKIVGMIKHIIWTIFKGI